MKQLLPDMSTTDTRDIKNEIVMAFHQSKFDVAKEYRNKALAFFEKTGLPAAKQEEYRFTPITKSLEKNFDWNVIQSTSAIESIEGFLIPNLDANILVFVNGKYSESLSKIISPESEVKIKALNAAFNTDGATLAPYFDKVLNPESDPFAAMNSALWQDGLFIHVPANTNVSNPFSFCI
jgi:Fe-S cluster assembly protein SufD